LTRFRDYYAILGVPRDATQEQIKEAYRRLVKIYHPDRNPSPEAEEMFKLINEAYQVLSDPARRAGYDVLYDAVMAEMAEASARVASETGEGVSRSGAYETYAAQETEELAEPERALITLCKAMVAYLLGSIGYEELIALTNDYVKTLKSSWGSAVRPEVRRLAMEAADLAEEREELGLMALFVKLFLAEAEPPHEKVYGAGRMRVKVAGATIVRRPSEVYNDLEKLLSSAQPGGYQEWVFGDIIHRNREGSIRRTWVL
jgi:DnaJ-domain-containing protein 1